MALDPDDMCSPAYRQQGLLIARGYPLVDMMNQIYSNTKTAERPPAADHVFGQGIRLLHDLGQSRTQYPQAVGWAMASAIKGDTASPRAGSATARPRKAISTTR
jgi:2-oxoisovalerate dehydrogenase E1 component alpha subunit